MNANPTGIANVRLKLSHHLLRGLHATSVVYLSCTIAMQKTTLSLQRKSLQWLKWQISGGKNRIVILDDAKARRIEMETSYAVPDHGNYKTLASFNVTCEDVRLAYNFRWLFGLEPALDSIQNLDE